MAIETLTAAEILAIPADRPDQLFENDEAKAHAQFRTLSKLWYPDLRPDDPKSADVFRHIKDLYEIAKIKIGTPAWSDGNKYTLTIKNGRTIKRAFRAKRDFELGVFYVGDAAITYVLRHEFEDFYKNALDQIAALKYPDDAVAAQIAPLMPSLETSFESDQGFVIVLRKTKNMLLLRDVLNHYGTITDRHTAWIFGRLANLCCYLQHVAKITHNGISPDTIFIDPQQHSAHLFGGWWYASPITAPKIIGVPSYTTNYGFPSIMRVHAPDYKNDLTLIRAVARELLGDVNGIKYRIASSTYPKPLVEWLSQPTSGKAIADYKSWEKCRDASFGKRTFVVMPISVQDLYPGTD